LKSSTTQRGESAISGRLGVISMHMTLMEYIQLHFNGDIYRYAQFEGVSREQVLKWINNECYVIKGKLVMPVKHLPAESYLR
jgi:hypothetical protein